MPSATRLNVFLARAGMASRRGADALIADGRVQIDGVVATPGCRVDPGQRVTVDGREVAAAEDRVYLMLHKPSGVVTTARDEKGRQTVLDIVRVHERVFPVGRLDLTTTGLLLLTNDGDLAARLTHPRHGVPKTYHALVTGFPDAATVARLAAGVELDDGPTAPAEVRVIGGDPAGAALEIVLREGRNRQVRRMCEAIGHPVRRLRRVAYGPLRLGNLAPGASRRLAAREVAALRRAAGLP